MDTKQEDEAWLAQREAFDATHSIPFDAQPRRWHSVIAPLRERLIAAAKDVPRMKRKAERPNPLSPEINLDGMEWFEYSNSGQILLHTFRAAPVRVSTNTYERALAILNAICFAADLRGYIPSIDEKQGRIVLTCKQGGSVQLRITERLNEAWRKEQTWDKRSMNVKFKEPSGTLRLYVGLGFGSEPEIADKRDSPLEQKLSNVFSRIYTFTVRHREWEREQQAWHRQHELAERRREQDERRRAQEEAKLAAEQRKRTALIEDAKAWQTATLIRSYVAFVEGDEAPPELAAWTGWALSVADDLEGRHRKKPDGSA